MNDEVEAWIRARISEEQAPIVQRLRELMQDAAPHATEEITYGILGWRVQRVIAVLNPTKRELTFSFAEGARLADPHGLLRGVGKRSKHVKVRSETDVDALEDALRDFVRQAMDLETPKGRA